MKARQKGPGGLRKPTRLMVFRAPRLRSVATRRGDEMGNPLPPSKRRRGKLASLLTKIQQTENAELRFELVGQLGKIRHRTRTNGRKEFYLDFQPLGYVYSNRGSPITDEYGARRLLERIRSEVADGASLGSVIASYKSQHKAKNLLAEKLTLWIHKPKLKKLTLAISLLPTCVSFKDTPRAMAISAGGTTRPLTRFATSRCKIG